MITNKKIEQIVSESLNKLIKEETEHNNNIINLISFLHNAQLPIREIHWNTRENALHLTTDETIKDLLEWEDTLAEAFISDKNLSVKINNTKPSSNDFKNILKELIQITTSVKNKITNKEDAICAVIDDILEGTSKHLYRGQFK